MSIHREIIIKSDEFLDTQRLESLLEVERLSEVTITAAGLGSVGAPVVQLLTMCGIRNWQLFDPDIIEPVNLVKHPARRVDIGRPKVEYMAEWIRDRNPNATVWPYQEDVRQNERFRNAVRESHLVISAVDHRGSRECINENCLQHGAPCISGIVFRTGFAGQVYASVPGITGCLHCLDSFCEQNGLSLADRFAITETEKHHIYGLNDKTFQLSGLPVDIIRTAGYQADLTLGLVVGNSDTPIPRLQYNWFVFGNRPHPASFRRQYENRKFLLTPQRSCPVGCSSRAPTSPATLLGVADDSSENDIKQAYHRLISKFHPDRAIGLSPWFQEVAQNRTIALKDAYEKLIGGR